MTSPSTVSANWANWSGNKLYPYGHNSGRTTNRAPCSTAAFTIDTARLTLLLTFPGSEQNCIPAAFSIACQSPFHFFVHVPTHFDKWRLNPSKILVIHSEIKKTRSAMPSRCVNLFLAVGSTLFIL